MKLLVRPAFQLLLLFLISCLTLCGCEDQYSSLTDRELHRTLRRMLRKAQRMRNGEGAVTSLDVAHPSSRNHSDEFPLREQPDLSERPREILLPSNGEISRDSLPSNREISRDSLPSNREIARDSLASNREISIDSVFHNNRDISRDSSPSNRAFSQRNPLLSNALSSRELIQGSRRATEITRGDYLRKDWCKTEPFVQVVRAQGCLKRKVLNRFCYGQCNSFFIPKLSRRDRLAAAFENCSTCKPSAWDWVTVTLRCPGLVPDIQRKRIQRVKQCKCMAQTIQ